MNADRYRIYNETRESLLATDAEVSDGTTGSADTRLFELGPGSRAALWISPFRDISPSCAPVPLDLIYVNSDGVVLDTIEFFPMNGRGARSAQATSVIALPADTVAKGGTRPGDRLQFSAAGQVKEQLREEQNGNGHLLETNAPIAEPENADYQETETGEADAGWMRITDVTRRKVYDIDEAKEVVENVDRPAGLSANPSVEDIESLLRQLRETNGSELDGGGVKEVAGKKEEGLVDMPGALVDGALPSISEEEPADGRQMPTGGANAEEYGSAEIAPAVDSGEFWRPWPAGSIAASEIAGPVDRPANAGYEGETVPVEYPRKTDLQLTTPAHAIFRSSADAGGHLDTKSAERTRGRNGGARSGGEAPSNSFAMELPRGKMPGGKPNAQQAWGKRGVGPSNWIERILLDDTPVRRSIQSLLMNDTATKGWILRWLVGTNPNDNWLEDMLSSEVLDPRKGPREQVPGLIAYFFTGGPAVRYPVRDISASGLYLLTKVRWYEGTVVQMTLTDQERPTEEGSITVQGKVVRAGDDGVGFEMLLEGSPAHDGRYERHVPTNGVSVAQLGGLVRMIKSKQAPEERVAAVR